MTNHLNLVSEERKRLVETVEFCVGRDREVIVIDVVEAENGVGNCLVH